MFFRIWGPAGTISDPVAVLASTRRRPRGLSNANCRASAPAPRDAQHVHLVAAQLIQDPIQRSDEAGKSIGS
jgi:hypothetical protein